MGYHIDMNQAGTLVYHSGSQGMLGPVGPEGEPLYMAASVGATGIQPEPVGDLAATAVALARTRSFREIWGLVTVDGVPAPAGTVVKALSPRGEVVGSFTVRQPGYYGYMRVYGEDDRATSRIPGMKVAEPLAFAIDGYDAPVVVTNVGWANNHIPGRLDLALQTAGGPR